MTDGKDMQSEVQVAVGGYGLTRSRFALLFTVTLVASCGNTAMQSLMPAIGRSLQVADIWIAIAFSLSATLWAVTAPVWARAADHRGRRVLMRIGLIGFAASFIVCGTALAVGFAGLLPPMLVFGLFIAGRGIYGGWGSASPPAVQAYIAARTDGEQRTAAIATLTSAFGLGTIIGPALAPLFVFEPLGLAGPMFVFAAIALGVLALLIAKLPDDAPTRTAKGRVTDYPVAGAPVGDGLAAHEDAPRLRWGDRRVRSWFAIGLVGGHAQAIILGMIGFLVIDRLSLAPAEAQHSIAIVMMAGAVATLFAQWWLIPQLGLSPIELIRWGTLISALGAVCNALSGGLYTMALSFALGSLGFGMFRPGFASGASLAVSRGEQNAVAGMLTAVNGISWIAGPAIGVLLYGIMPTLPLFVTAAILAGLTLWTTLFSRPSAPAA